MFGETTISYVKIWFIQLKRPFINACFRFQVLIISNNQSPSFVPKGSKKSAFFHLVSDLQFACLLIFKKKEYIHQMVMQIMCLKCSPISDSTKLKNTEKSNCFRFNLHFQLKRKSSHPHHCHPNPGTRGPSSFL